MYNEHNPGGIGTEDIDVEGQSESRFPHPLLASLDL